MTNIVEAPPPQLSNGARTTISFLLFVHLFALAVAIASNTSAVPVVNEPADLKRQLRQVPGIVPYLQVLNMDYAYTQGSRFQGADFHLTHDLEMDLAYRVELTLNLADGTEQPVTLPNPAMQPRLRRRHFEMLASRAARLAGYEPADAELPLAIGTHYVRAYGANGGRLRCVAELEHSMQDYEQVNPATGGSLPAVASRTPLDYYLLPGEKLQLMSAQSSRDAAAPSRPSDGSPPPSQQSAPANPSTNQ